MSETIKIGNNNFSSNEQPINGGFIELNGEKYYKIANYDKMRPFFISLVSHADHWMFISSSGGVSAGRKDEDNALFPYYTDDKISQSPETTGSKTIFHVERSGKRQLWEPFSDRYEGIYNLSRNIYKNIYGNKLIFEEVNHDLSLTYRYSWSFSEQYGFVKGSTILNDGSDKVALNVLDGIQNILPYGVNSAMQNNRSNLVNAYKKNELDQETGLGIFTLSSMIVDKAEPSESLKASLAWSAGLSVTGRLLCSLQVDNFRKTGIVNAEHDVKAEAGAYFLNASFELAGAQSRKWYICAEVNCDYVHTVQQLVKLKNTESLIKSLEEDIEQGTRDLIGKVAKADGLQLTNDGLTASRHYANVLFNIMRGGLFEDQYLIMKYDLQQYAEIVNRSTYKAHQKFFGALPDHFLLSELLDKASAADDADLVRVCREYLPLTFSRRHGDPSRPWNRFSIELKTESGERYRHYAGNWRDIFQNWEALAFSIPGFITSMIAKFVNASTVDGYNPYRISKEGIDWEVIEPDDPWSYIGYWGDHQIIYLQKLLEVASQHFEEDLFELLDRKEFVYANVPYRIKSYSDIVADPQDTILFDEELDREIGGRVQKIGSDGRLVLDKDHSPVKANLTEKLLVAVTAKLSNFVPEAGIWLNTQRPEWNDANNALVGNGVSMVTLYYLRRNIAFLAELVGKAKWEKISVHQELSELVSGISQCFAENESLLSGPFPDDARREFVDQLGVLGQSYRDAAYNGFSSTSDIPKSELLSLFSLTLKYLDHSIYANRRSDGLYHAYNLISFKDNKLEIGHLYEMLEGQVAVLSAGVLSLGESLSVLDALKQSDIYREDQYSYMLYPDRDLPRFLDKNVIPKDFVEQSTLAQKLLAEGDTTLLSKDALGAYHFNGNFNNSNSLRAALNRLKKGNFGPLVEVEYEAYLQTFEQMFNHKAFTGRSGTFFGYEGLGSIYWHMVSKLLLATQECIWAADPEELESSEMGKMVDHYYEIRAGIGINKSPELYGSFPTDPYSHTPGNKGAQQPGMTGQVKEDILNRWAELGVRVANGSVSFEPRFLNRDEFLKNSQTFRYVDQAGKWLEIPLEKDELAFTYCQVPVIYHLSASTSVKITMSTGEVIDVTGSAMTSSQSAELFMRTGRISKIKVDVIL